MSDITSARRAAAEIAALDLPIAGLLTRPFKTAQGWDGTFATDHIGPFALTEALIPHLPDRANVVFVCSAVEDPQRKPAVAAGFRGAAARVITRVLTDNANRTGVYYNEKGQPMLGSAQVRDPAFQDRFVAETRALLASLPTNPQPS